MSGRPRVLIAHPYLRPSGGGNAVAAWAIEALRHHYSVHLATLAPVDCATVNESFGTSLIPNDFELHLPPVSYRCLLQFFPFPGALLELNLTNRWARQVDRRHRFDVVLSTQNEMDFGRHGLQYVHYPWLYLPRPADEIRWYHHAPGALATYRYLCRRIGGSSTEGLRQNRSLANSRFVAGRFLDVYGVPAEVLYPPVAEDFPTVPWESRASAFVAVGRIHPTKRWLDALAIVESLRARGHQELGFTLIGHEDDRHLVQHLRGLERTRPWFRLLTNLSRPQLLRELLRHRYALHPMHEEHFGIAPAEIVKSGCLLFAHDSGGPREIVGFVPELLFSTIEQGVDRAQRVLVDPQLAQRLRDHLARQGSLFSTTSFMRQLREYVRGSHSPGHSCDSIGIPNA